MIDSELRKHIHSGIREKFLTGAPEEQRAKVFRYFLFTSPGLDPILYILYDFFFKSRNIILENNFAIFIRRRLSEIYTSICNSLFETFYFVFIATSLLPYVIVC